METTLTLRAKGYSWSETRRLLEEQANQQSQQKEKK